PRALHSFPTRRSSDLWTLPHRGPHQGHGAPQWRKHSRSGSRGSDPHAARSAPGRRHPSTRRLLRGRGEGLSRTERWREPRSAAYDARTGACAGEPRRLQSAPLLRLHRQVRADRFPAGAQEGIDGRRRGSAGGGLGCQGRLLAPGPGNLNSFIEILMEIRRETRGAIRILTIANERIHNACGEGMAKSLLDEFDDAERDPAIRVVVVTGAGSAAFSTGHDLKEIENGSYQDTGLGEAPFLRPLTMSKPVIAAVNGHCYAAAFILALSCDIRVASRNAAFGSPGARLG